MISIPLAQAKNQLSELIVRVERGETVAVTRRGKAVAQLIGVTADTSDLQSEQVQHVFARLSQLRSGVELHGDIKDIARKGLA